MNAPPAASLKIGSLFAGIGGFEIGLERGGLGPVVWQAECDPFCRRVLARHWPHATHYERVEHVDERAERVDVLCGGFPCQDVSFAGVGTGIAGARSSLWFEYLRIVRAIRPRWVLVENVPALFVRGFDAVLGGLAASGYDAIWDCIPAAAVGAPHRRDRIFIIARDVSDAQRARSQGGRSAESSGRAEFAATRAHVADGDGGRRQVERFADHRAHESEAGDELDRCDVPPWPPAPADLHAWRRMPAETQPAICRLANGISARLGWIVGRGRREALRAYGNAVVPQVAELIGRAIYAAETGGEG